MASNQKIIITDKNQTLIDSVSAVKSFDEDGVLIDSQYGLISVEGKDLRIENFEKAKSEILITGNISGVFYLEKKEKKKGRVVSG